MGNYTHDCILLYKLQCVIGILATEKCPIRAHVLGYRIKHMYPDILIIKPLEYSPFEIIDLNLYNK